MEYSIQCNHTEFSTFNARDVVIKMSPPYFMNVTSKTTKSDSLSAVITNDVNSVTLAVSIYEV